MKNNILKATIVAAFALIAGMNVYNAQKSDVMSDLALANVEALAQSEGSGSSGCRYRMASRCGGSGGFDCCDTCSGAYCGYFIDTQGTGTKLYYK